MRKWIIIILALTIIAIVGYKYIYQDHRTIENETAEYVITSLEIESQFSKDTKNAEAKYLNKTVEISGIVSEINTNDITLDDKIFCLFSETIDASIKDKTIQKIKGRVIGYDDLLEQVKLDQCTINNN